AEAKRLHGNGVATTSLLKNLLGRLHGRREMLAELLRDRPGDAPDGHQVSQARLRERVPGAEARIDQGLRAGLSDPFDPEQLFEDSDGGAFAASSSCTCRWTSSSPGLIFKTSE